MVMYVRMYVCVDSANLGEQGKVLVSGNCTLQCLIGTTMEQLP